MTRTRRLANAAFSALLSLLAGGEGNTRWFGLIGLVPLGTALLNWCPLYTLFGFNTCSVSGKKPG